MFLLLTFEFLLFTFPTHYPQLHHHPKLVSLIPMFNYFPILYSAMIFENGKVFFAPALRVNDLSKLKFADFKYVIPTTIKGTDTITVTDRKKRTILYDFRLATLTINGKKYKNCLNLKIFESWPDEKDYSTVWLNKKYGILKWIRPTGRIDTREL